MKSNSSYSNVRKKSPYQSFSGGWAKIPILPMRELQTMAGSLLLDKIWKEGWKVDNSTAFWRYNEKRESAAANLSQNSGDKKSEKAQVQAA